METNEYAYMDGTTSCKGYLAYPSKIENPPIVMIAPTWEGINTFAKDIAEHIATSGYAAFVVDIYGEGKTVKGAEEASKLMLPLFMNRALLRERIYAAYKAAQKLPDCDPSRLAAIGFCFGGLTVIELLRSGASLNGIVSFHGLLASELEGKKAALVPNANEYNASFLLLHGYKDPLVPMDHVVELQKELSEKNIDWQTHIYGTAAHAFTNPEAADKEGGMYFDPRANERSMKTLYHYLKEIFTHE